MSPEGDVMHEHFDGWAWKVKHTPKSLIWRSVAAYRTIYVGAPIFCSLDFLQMCKLKCFCLRMKTVVF